MPADAPAMGEISERDLGVLVTLTGVFAASIVMANLLAGVKLEKLLDLELFGLPLSLVVPAGTIAYAWTFPITDVVDEVYGKRRAYYVVWAGLGAEAAMLALIILDYPIPPLEPSMQELYERVFMTQPRIVLASVLAYVVSQHHDVWAFWKWRQVTRGRHLWVRNNLSTMTSQLIDTTVFTTVAFGGLVPIGTLALIALSTWLVKLFIAAIDTPFVYLGVWLIKRPLVGKELGAPRHWITRSKQ